MAKKYVSKIEGAYRIADTRVSLDSLICLFRESLSVEGMVDACPALSLEQVHGALVFYLANKPKIDAYLLQGKKQGAQKQIRSNRSNADLITKVQRTRLALHATLEHESPIPG